MILRREDVAGDPAHVGAEIGQRLDQHRGLHGHVQAAHDLGAGERPFGLVLLANRHQTGHFLLGETDFLAAELVQRQVGDFEGLPPGGLRRGERVQGFFDGRGHASSFVQSVMVDGSGFVRFFGRAPRAAVAANSVGPLAAGSAGNSRKRSPSKPARSSVCPICSAEKPIQTWPIRWRYSWRS